MIQYTEFGCLADENTENVDVYAYFEDEIAREENRDVISVACTHESGAYKIEITNHDNEVVYTTYLESGIEVDNLINLLDAVLGVTDHRTNIDD